MRMQINLIDYFREIRVESYFNEVIIVLTFRTKPRYFTCIIYVASSKCLNIKLDRLRAARICFNTVKFNLSTTYLHIQQRIQRAVSVHSIVAGMV